MLQELIGIQVELGTKSGHPSAHSRIPRFGNDTSPGRYTAECGRYGRSVGVRRSYQGRARA